IIGEAGGIFGDGVNITAPLENLCEPGGLCVSPALRGQVRDKMPIDFDDFGEQRGKKIARPGRAFRLNPQAIHILPDLAPSGPVLGSHRNHWLKAGGLAAVAILLTGIVFWADRTLQSMVRSPEYAVKDGNQVGSSRASIVVLPLEDRGGGA